MYSRQDQFLYLKIYFKHLQYSKWLPVVLSQIDFATNWQIEGKEMTALSSGLVD